MGWKLDDDARAGALWILLLTAAGTATTLVLACSTPFAALAALAAVHMPRRDGVMLVVVAWLASQVVGFGIHGYAQDLHTLAWALGIGAAAVGSALGAGAALSRFAGQSFPIRLAAALLAAFVAYNAVLAICALGLGGIATTLEPVNLARQFLRNGAVLVGLLGFYHALVAAGVPAARARGRGATVPC
jgi:hypothetical protein